MPPLPIAPCLPLAALLLAAQPAPPAADPPLPEMAEPDAPPPAAPAPAAPPPATPTAATDDEGSRVVRGTPAAPGSAPWQIQVITTVKLTPAELAEDAARPEKDPKKNHYDRMDEWERDHRCGGVLIGDGWALSAAHCFVTRTDRLNPLSSRAVRLGSNDVLFTTPMRVERVIVHGDYHRTGNRRHDIALLKLEPTAATDRARLAATRPVAMPDAQTRPPAMGDAMLVTGWGNTGQREAGAARDVDGKLLRNSRDLLEGRQMLLDPARCAAVPSYVATLNPGVLCVGAGDARNQDSCQGDSGGPLTRRGLLVGLVSGGEGCGLPGQPALYTNVAHYLGWIADMKRLSRPGMMARCRTVTRAGKPALACTG